MIGGVAAAVALGLLLSACGPARPTGAAPLRSDAEFGATEQTADATESPVPDAPRPTATRAAPASLTTPFTCPQGDSTTVYDSAQLKKALAAARPGDVINMEPGTYIGHFTIKAKGSAARPIYLCGSQDSVMNGRALNHGYVLHLDGAENWRLSGFSVENGLKGIMMDAGRNNVLQNLRVESTGNEGIHLRKNSVGNVVQFVTIRKTGRQKAKFGEGLYVGSSKNNWCDVTHCEPDRSDRNVLLNNKIFLTSSESVDVKEGTSNGVISGNTFDGRGMSDADSWVDVKGNGWRILGNHGKYSTHDGYQTHVILKGWGTGNVFSGNSADLVQGSGVAFFIQKKLTNRLLCDNQQEGAEQGLANIACSG